MMTMKVFPIVEW